MLILNQIEVVNQQFRNYSQSEGGFNVIEQYLYKLRALFNRKTITEVISTHTDYVTAPKRNEAVESS